nr:DUF5682 family protein [Streptomyces sp. AJS327]
MRHHGPGSARAVGAALAAYRPEVLLVEGPPEADAVVSLAADEGMRPPVALLAHARGEPGRAAFWPLAEFSPEWVAIRWALEAGVPVRFVDLPAAHSLALAAPATEGDAQPPSDEPELDKPPEAGEPSAPMEPSTPGESSEGAELRADPLAALARAAGYDDAERWWEDAVEHRLPAPAPHPSVPADPSGPATSSQPPSPYAPFAALAEAMTALRESFPPSGETDAARSAGPGTERRDLIREAHMRLRLREAQREFGAGSVAVVCGAWHVPALARRSTVTADRALLKGLPKVRAEVTWVPWTHRRLARAGGYGAGVTSPGWYAHLFHSPDRPLERWMTRVARLLRAEDHSASSAHVIEAVRLAESLAALRGRPLAGLGECVDAVRAVLCEGSDVPLALVEDRLVVGEALGEVPEGAPAVPLQRDLSRAQRSLRLTPSAAERRLDLDLRGETDAARSRLFHQLRLLGVDWARPVAERGGTGTFRESWSLCWEPELAVRVAEAGVWGTTLPGAATAKAEAEAVGAESLAEVTALAERCLLAGLPDALPVVMRALADRAALDTNVGQLAEALPALVRSARYGDVRGSDGAALTEVAAGLAERVRVGLPPACVGLDASGAEAMRAHLDAVHQSVSLLAQTAPVDDAADPGSGVPPNQPEQSGAGREFAPEGLAGLPARWRAVLRALAERDRIPGLLRGRCVRLLLDDGRLADAEAARLMGLALSSGAPAAGAAAWIEGFLSGGGMLLVHDARLLGLVDGWLGGVPEDSFIDVLPLLRRTFADLEEGVRRTVGELVRRGPRAGNGPPTSGGGGRDPEAALDPSRARAVLPVLERLLGAPPTAVARVPATPDAATAAPPTGPRPDPEPASTAGPFAPSVAGPLAEPEVDRAGVVRRWRLVLGGSGETDGTGCVLGGRDAALDRTLEALYGARTGRSGGYGAVGRGRSGRSAGLGGSAPDVARWLGDIRAYFPSSVVQVMQRDAMDRLGLSAMLLEPELMEAVEPDVHLVGTLLSLNKAMPETSRETARAVVRRVVTELERRLAGRTRSTLGGALDRAARIHRPRHRDIDWDRTIRANLRHYLPEHRTVVPERLVGFGRAANAAKKEVILCVDQSGSMASSVVYASVFGAVLASMRSLSTRIVVFDTSVVDLTDAIDDPVDVLFGTQLGGGTDINRALAYCQSRISRPNETVVVLVSDLYEGGIRNEMLKRVAAMRAAGVRFVSLLALSDDGAPSYDREHAAALAALGAPAFACTPDQFPEVMAAAIERRALPAPEATATGAA